MKKTTLKQLNILMAVMYAICFPLLFFLILKEFEYTDTWIDKNRDSIIEYDATILECTKDNHDDPYYDVTVKLSNGSVVVIKKEYRVEGTTTVYSFTKGNRTYYDFSENALKSDVNTVRYAVFLIVMMNLLCGPLVIYYVLREIHGYPYWRKRSDDEYMK